MNAIQNRDGHSRRRKTIYNLRKIFSIVDRLKSRSKLFLSVLLALVISSCHEKSNGQDSRLSKSQPQASDSLNKPKVDIRVNKHFDNKGNMIGFDSTYSSYYSNIEGDTMGMDTLFNRFDTYFKNHHSMKFGKEFNDLFFRDSLFYPDFFHKDFFQKRYELNDLYLKDMMQRMDSVKNKFYLEQKKGRAKDL